MGFIKIAAAVFILGAGLTGSYFIVKNSAPAASIADFGDESKLSDALNDLKNAGDLLTGKNPIQWTEKSSGKSAAAPDSFQAPDSGAGVGSEENSRQNFTKLVASSIFSGMRRMEEENKNPTNYFNLSNPSDASNKKAVEEAVSSLKNPLPFLNVSINDDDLKISPDNSEESKINYLKSTAEIIMDNSNEFSGNPLKALEKLTYGDVSAINKVIDSYSEIYKGFLNTPAPRDWLVLHKRYLGILKKTEIIYRGMADFQNDPVKASLSGEALPQTVEAEAKIRKEYYQKETELRN